MTIIKPNARRLGPPPRRDFSRLFQSASGRRSRARRLLADVALLSELPFIFVHPICLSTRGEQFLQLFRSWLGLHFGERRI
jgi:hypothetical protein